MTAVLACVVILGSCVAIYLQAGDVHAGAPSQAYFSNDDGVTFFADRSTKLPPFDKDGKQAVRAHVCECGGKRFVGYLSRYTADAQKLIEEAKAYNGTGKPPPNVQALSSLGSTGMEVKRPGPKNPWIKQGDLGRATPVRAIKCPDGTPAPEVDP